jgi:hypothetical protein
MLANIVVPASLRKPVTGLSARGFPITIAIAAAINGN